MGLRPLLGVNLAAMAFAAAPSTLRWTALIVVLTTMMMGADSQSFQYSGKPKLEFEGAATERSGGSCDGLLRRKEHS